MTPLELPVMQHYQARILIVDDAEFNLALLSEVLRSHGYEQIDTALDGLAAMDKIKQSPPDLILLDLMMPNMDGFEFCEQLRANPLWRDIPVVVQTGAEDPEMRMRALRLGATDLLTKPVNADELVMRVQIHLERRYMMDELKRFKERVEDELEHAKHMQLEILPSLAQKNQIRQRYRVGVASHATTSSELGGDFWSMIPLDSYQFAVVSCDFSGHGVGAALNTFRLHTMLQEIFHTIHRPDHALEIINQRMYHLLPRGQFATLFVGVIDTKDEKLCYAAAGCPAPLLVRKHAEPAGIALDSAGMLVGVESQVCYPLREVSFSAHDTLLLYSDALIETPNIAGQFLKEERLLKGMEQALNAAPEDIAPEEVVVNSMLDMLQKHSDQPLSDDLTLAAFHYYQS